MKRLSTVLLFIALWAMPSWAASNVITTSGTTCVLEASCLIVNLPEDKGGATLTLSGTWTGTISFEATGDGGATWVAVNVTPLASTTAVTSATANGTWQVNAAGFTGLRMRASATMSGSATATITPSAASARSGGGGGGSGGGITNSAGANVVMKSDGTNAVASSITDSGTTVSTAEPITAPIWDNGGAVYNAMANGFACDDSTDDTSAFNTLLGVLYTNGGGTIQFPPGKFCLISGQVVFPKNATTPWSSPPYRITGQVNTFTMTDAHGSIIGGGGLDLQYASGPKMVSEGGGVLEIDHLTLKDTSTDCQPFLQTTLTDVQIHNNTFLGTHITTTACNDAIILGGTNDLPTPLNGSINDRFQGYGTVIRDNAFEKIRTAMKLQRTGNGVQFLNNIISFQSGGGVANAIELDGGTGMEDSGNQVSGNVIELTGYTGGCGISMSYARWNTFVNNSFWDALGTAYAFCTDGTAVPGSVIIGNMGCSGIYCTPFNASYDQSLDTQIMADGGNLFPNTVGLAIGNDNLYQGSDYELELKNGTNSMKMTIFTSSDGIVNNYGSNYAGLSLQSNYTGASPGITTIGSGTGGSPDLWIVPKSGYVKYSTSFYEQVTTGNTTSGGTSSYATHNSTGLATNTLYGGVTSTGPTNYANDTTPAALTAGTPTSGGSCTAGTHSWVVTFITAFGESLPSAKSADQTCGVAATVPLSVIPVGPVGTTGRNIYATKTGDTGSYYLGCASAPCISNNTTTTFSFTLADASLGATAPAANTTAGGNVQVAGTTKQIIGGTKNLTSAAASTILSIPLATLQTTGGQVEYTIQASGGTNQCALSGTLNFAGENSASVFVVSPTTGAGLNEATTCTSGSTLTDSWALTAANPTLLQVTPTTSMTATSFTIIYNVQYQGNTQPTRF